MAILQGQRDGISSPLLHSLEVHLLSYGHQPPTAGWQSLVTEGNDLMLPSVMCKAAPEAQQLALLPVSWRTK